MRGRSRNRRQQQTVETDAVVPQADAVNGGYAGDAMFAGDPQAMLTAIMAQFGGGGATALNAQPTAPSDPVLGAFSKSSDWRQSGSFDSLTASSLGAALNGFAAGEYATIAPIWEVMQRRDDAVLVAYSKIRRKVCREVRNWQVLPADDSAEAKRQAEWLTAFYNRLQARSLVRGARRGGVRTAVELCLDAIAKQYSILAKEWTGFGDDLTLTLKHVPLWNFREEEGALKFVPQNSGGAAGVEIDYSQWLVAVMPEAAMEAASVLVLFKRLPAHQVMTILSRWGIPRVYGSCPDKKGSAGWNAMVEALQAIQNGLNGVVGGSGKIDPIKIDQAAQHIPWIEYCDRGITNIFLGSHLGTKAESDTGSLAGGAQADDTDDIEGDICDWASELFQKGIDRDALLYGYGTEHPLCYFEIVRGEARDDAADMKLLEGGVKLGVPIAVSHARERFGWPEPEGDEPLLGVRGQTKDTEETEKTEKTEKTEEAAANSASAGSARALQAGSVALGEQIADELGIPSGWLAPVEGFLRAIEDHVAAGEITVGDLEAFLVAAAEEAPELFGEMDLDALASLFEAAMGAAVMEGVRNGLQDRKEQSN